MKSIHKIIPLFLIATAIAEAETVNESLVVNGHLNVHTNNDPVLTFNNTDNSWQYLQFKQSGTRKTWMGLDNYNNFTIAKENGGRIILTGSDVLFGSSGSTQIGGAPYSAYNNNNLGLYTTRNIGLASKWATVNFPLDDSLLDGNTGAWWLFGRPWGETNKFGLIIRPAGISREIDAFYVTSQGEATSPYIDRFVIPGGNVGIGTTTPTHKLSVNGAVRAKEVIVDTGWSDFVFEDGYYLRPLGEVESHIEKHGHLPDVPSAAVVESEGLSVGEAQKIMMQKIEELTLYMIDLKKENDALKERVAELESN